MHEAKGWAREMLARLDNTVLHAVQSVLSLLCLSRSANTIQPGKTRGCSPVQQMHIHVTPSTETEDSCDAFHRNYRFM